MLLIAATSYNQTSRKTANTNTTATQVKPNTSSRQNSSTVTRSPNENRVVNNNRNERSNPATRNENTTPPTTRNNENQIVGRNNPPTTRNTNTNRVENNSTSRSHNYSPGNNNPPPRTSRRTEAVTYNSPRVYRERHIVAHNYPNPPRSREYRSSHYVYRRPVHLNIYWTPVMHRHFMEIYPMVPYWNYHSGYRIEMISTYDASYYQGEVMTVYGSVNEVYYSRATDEYFLYFGPYYPYQDFTVVMPGYLARRYSRHPEGFFAGQYLAITGLITTFDGEPEIVVKEKFQINIY